MVEVLLRDGGIPSPSPIPRGPQLFLRPDGALPLPPQGHRDSLSVEPGLRVSCLHLAPCSPKGEGGGGVELFQSPGSALLLPPWETSVSHPACLRLSNYTGALPEPLGPLHTGGGVSQ